ncbi:MAG: EF-P beta-lysylation protein EpmB [Planctomycetaceae bacterium]
MAPQPEPDCRRRPLGSNWHRELADALRDPEALIDRLDLPENWREPARRAAKLFPLLVTESYLRRIEPGNPHDPLLRQVLPLDAEFHQPPGFTADAVGDHHAQLAPGLLKKYAGRALLIATGACAIHCRYCFRRHFPYGEAPRRLDEWEPALEALRRDESIQEILLSGGDPLMLTDQRLQTLLSRLSEIPHLVRLRIHSRLPIVLPSRITSEFLELITSQRLTPMMVVHANHPRELDESCRAALRRLVCAGVPVLNQAVLLRGVNDEITVLRELCDGLVNLGVMPYYLHQLDRVQGAAHFEVDEESGRTLIAELRRQLPGYAVPEYVRETVGAAHKLPIR